jgi:hypothetical protein
MSVSMLVSMPVSVPELAIEENAMNLFNNLSIK